MLTRTSDEWTGKIRVIIRSTRRHVPGVLVAAEEQNTIFGRQVKIILSGPEEKCKEFGNHLVNRGARKCTEREYIFKG